MKKELQQILDDAFKPLHHRPDRMANNSAKRKGTTQPYSNYQSNHERLQYPWKEEKFQSISSKPKHKDESSMAESCERIVETFLAPYIDQHRRMKVSKSCHQDEIPMEKSVEFIVHKGESYFVPLLVKKVDVEENPNIKHDGKVLEVQSTLASNQGLVGEKSGIRDSSVIHEVKFEGKKEVKLEESVKEKRSEDSSESSEIHEKESKLNLCVKTSGCELTLRVEQRVFVLMTNHPYFVLPSIFVDFGQVSRLLDMLNCGVVHPWCPFIESCNIFAILPTQGIRVFYGENLLLHHFH